MVLAKIGGLNISAGVPFMPKGANYHLDPLRASYGCFQRHHTLLEKMALV